MIVELALTKSTYQAWEHIISDEYQLKSVVTAAIDFIESIIDSIDSGENVVGIIWISLKLLIASAMENYYWDSIVMV